MSRKRRTVRYSDEEWQRAQRRAEEEGMPTSTYVREVSIGDLEVSSARSRQKIVARLFQVGTHLKALRERVEGAGADPSPRGGGGAPEPIALDQSALDEALERVHATLDALGAYRGVEVSTEAGAPSAPHAFASRERGER